MAGFDKILWKALSYVLETKSPNKMFAYHKESARWRDVNEFIAEDRDTVDVNNPYFYDTEHDPHDSIRSYFVMSMWHFAIDVDWATSLEFAQRCGPLYAVDTPRFDPGHIPPLAMLQKETSVTCINGFRMIPTIYPDEPPAHFLTASEGDAVILRLHLDEFHIDD